MGHPYTGRCGLFAADDQQVSTRDFNARVWLNLFALSRLTGTAHDVSELNAGFFWLAALSVDISFSRMAL